MLDRMVANVKNEKMFMDKPLAVVVAAVRGKL